MRPFFLLREQIPTVQLWGVFGGEVIIIVTGIIDDIFVLKPRQKVLGISLAALEVYFVAGLKMAHLTLPFVGMVDLGWLSLPVTWLWILAITNAVNLIDGLDGLATGVGIISLSTMGVTGLFFLNVANTFVGVAIFALVAAMIGFLPYNFFPARIYLGDTGALFIGFMISVFFALWIEERDHYLRDYSRDYFRGSYHRYGIRHFAPNLKQATHLSR